MIRVYDTPALYREDTILRIRHLEYEIADMQKEIDRQKQKAVAAMERLERVKKWLGITDHDDEPDQRKRRPDVDRRSKTSRALTG